ncbi:hypothetical protein NI392_09165 [Vibrio alginolyticus]|uniref:hypothetical protein n=1 Tax=Vibrio alginolyticus TaxID=663 RepID=UPI0028F44E21|nr:hypothetical protein [Vibrio alginolyticus]WMN48321.1 hypothetical protein NI392_09165 [Vibrio alginolyticus]
MSVNVSPKELCGFIFHIEDKYNLNNFEINDVYIWQYLRMGIYYKLALALNIYEEPHKKSNLSFFEKIKFIPGLIKFSFVNNPYFKLSKFSDTDVLIFEHERSKSINNQVGDIYSDHIVELELANGKRVSVIDKPESMNRNFLKTTWLDKRIYVDYIYVLNSLFSRFVPLKEKDRLFELAMDLEREFFRRFDISFDFYKLFCEGYKRYVMIYGLYDRLFKKLKPETLYIVVAYGFKDVVSAAKNNGVKVIELQHGVVNKFHLGYSYTGLRFSDTYLPDEVICWSDNWTKSIEWRVKKTSSIPFKYQVDMLNKYLDCNGDRNSVTVLSQGAITFDILNYFISKYDSIFSNIDKVYYKLHPSEFSIRDTLSRELGFANVVVVCGEIDLYEMFSVSHTVYGVFSTALFEAQEMRCKIKLFPLEGVEFVRDHPGFDLLDS